MKKALFVFVFIIGAAAAGIPFFKGYVLEKLVRQSVNDINNVYADTGSDIVFKIRQYTRGYFSSQIEWAVKLGTLKTIYGIEEIICVDRAAHGFLKIESVTSLEKNKWFKGVVNEKLEGKNPLSIRTEYKLSGEINSVVSLEKCSFTSGRDRIKVKPGMISISLNKGGKTIIAQMAWKGCSGFEKFKMDDLFMQADLNKVSTYIWDGDVSFKIKRAGIERQNQTREVFNLQCDYKMAYDKKDQSLFLEVGYGFDQMLSAKRVIKDAFCQIGINRLDAKGYEAVMMVYGQEIKDLLKVLVQSGRHDSPAEKLIEAQMKQVGFKMIGTYEKVLKNKTQIQVSDLRATLPEGDVKGSILLRLKEDITMGKVLGIMIQPKRILDSIYLESNIVFPSELIEGDSFFVSPIYPGMQTGLFLKNGKVLNHNAVTMNGKLYLNEKEVLFN